jgi:hypothetical protein
MHAVAVVRWNPVPKADDRRTPVVANVRPRSLSQPVVEEEEMACAVSLARLQDWRLFQRASVSHLPPAPPPSRAPCDRWVPKAQGADLGRRQRVQHCRCVAELCVRNVRLLKWACRFSMPWTVVPFPRAPPLLTRLRMRALPFAAVVRRFSLARLIWLCCASPIDLMHVWPTYNHHTDYTGVYSAVTGAYSSVVWY